MSMKLHADGLCAARHCRRVGPTWHDVDDPTSVSLCDACRDAQRRWEAWETRYTSGLGYYFGEPPPITPPVVR